MNAILPLRYSPVKENLKILKVFFFVTPLCSVYNQILWMHFKNLIPKKVGDCVVKNGSSMALPKNAGLLIFVSIIIMGGLLSACGRIQGKPTQDSADLIIDMVVEPAQPVVGSAQLIFTITDKQGQPINDATLDVEGNMSHAGMTPVFAQGSGGEEGRYVVPFEWTMAGDWFVTVDVSLENGEVISRQFPVSVE